MIMKDFTKDPRFEGVKPFEKKIWLASPTMHGEEQKWINDAFEKNWITTAGENINVIEKKLQSTLVENVLSLLAVEQPHFILP